MRLNNVVEADVMGEVKMEEPSCFEKVNKLLTCVDVPTQQKLELHALLEKWNKVFAVDEEDFGRTDLVHIAFTPVMQHL